MMGSCTLRIELQDERVHSRQTIRGVVHVQVERECTCDGLEIRPVFQLTGYDDQTDHPGPVSDIFRGRWTPGEHTVSFELRAPAHPFEYLGRYVSASWQIQARARIRGGRDAFATRDFTLVAPDGLGYRVRLKTPGDPAKVEPDEADLKASSNLGPYGYAAFMGLGGVGALGWGVQSGQKELVYGGVLMLVFFVLITIGIRQLRDSDKAGERRVRTLGRPQLQAEQVSRARGTDHQDADPQDTDSTRTSPDLHCTVWVRPDAPEARVKVTLTVKEHSSVPQGEHNSITYEHIVHSRAVYLKPTEPGRYEGKLPVPDAHEVPGSFGSSRDSIDWRLVAWLDFQELGWTHTIDRRVLTELTDPA